MLHLAPLFTKLFYLIIYLVTPVEIDKYIDKDIYFANMMLWIAWDSTLCKKWLQVAVICADRGCGSQICSEWCAHQRNNFGLK